MSTRERFARHGATVEWKADKVVVRVGRDGHRIVCSPAAFRWLKGLIEHTDWTDPSIEAELAEAHLRRIRSLRRKDARNSRGLDQLTEPEHESTFSFPFVGDAPPLSEFSVQYPFEQASYPDD